MTGPHQNSTTKRSSGMTGSPKQVSYIVVTRRAVMFRTL